MKPPAVVGLRLGLVPKEPSAIDPSTPHRLDSSHNGITHDSSSSSSQQSTIHPPSIHHPSPQTRVHLGALHLGACAATAICKQLLRPRLLHICRNIAPAHCPSILRLPMVFRSLCLSPFRISYAVPQPRLTLIGYILAAVPLCRPCSTPFSPALQHKVALQRKNG